MKIFILGEVTLLAPLPPPRVIADCYKIIDNVVTHAYRVLYQARNMLGLWHEHYSWIFFFSILNHQLINFHPSPKKRI